MTTACGQQRFHKIKGPQLGITRNVPEGLRQSSAMQPHPLEGLLPQLELVSKHKVPLRLGPRRVGTIDPVHLLPEDVVDELAEGLGGCPLTTSGLRRHHKPEVGLHTHTLAVRLWVARSVNLALLANSAKSTAAIQADGKVNLRGMLQVGDLIQWRCLRVALLDLRQLVGHVALGREIVVREAV